jgi:GAF domain-containing protein
VSLRWSWLATPYLVCATVIFAVALAGALTRGDRVLRLGVIGASITALPWTICQSIAACTDDPTLAWRLLRLGQGPVALVGPNLLLVLLGASGQLERHRWIARVAGVTGMSLLVVCWTTTWTVPGVQVIPSGMFYIRPGPLTAIHVGQLVLWLVIGIAVARRAAPQGERKRTVQILFAILVFAAIASFDSLLLYSVWGFYPIAWLAATIAATLSLYLVVRTDFLRPQGFDRAVALELGFALIAFVILAGLMLVAGPSLSIVVLGAVVWAACSGLAWGLMRARPVRVAGERALEQFVARVATIEDEAKIAERLGALWQTAIVGFEIRSLWWRDGATFTQAAGEQWTIEADVMSWFVNHSEALAVSDLATMKVGPIRGQLEAMTKHAAGDGAVIVPLVDRGELVGVVEAHHASALRESERGLIADSAHAAARALTFVGLSRAASRERETAREVEVADALRRQASASRDAELGRWAVAAEYRTAPRTTGAGWSAIELVDGRLALLVTEAQSHGVAGALATAALTGAFAAATAPFAVRTGPTGSVRSASTSVASPNQVSLEGANPASEVAMPERVLVEREPAQLTLDALIVALRASSEGVMRGGEPVAAFLALLDAQAQTIEFTCAGHPGGFMVGPIATIDGSLPMGSRKSARPTATALGGGAREPDASMSGAKRQIATLPPDTLVVVASSALRGIDDDRWEVQLREAAPASGRLASVLVELALRRSEPSEDLLAVVVRAR